MEIIFLALVLALLRAVFTSLSSVPSGSSIVSASTRSKKSWHDGPLLTLRCLARCLAHRSVGQVVDLACLWPSRLGSSPPLVPCLGSRLESPLQAGRPLAQTIRSRGRRLGPVSSATLGRIASQKRSPVSALRLQSQSGEFWGIAVGSPAAVSEAALNLLQPLRPAPMRRRLNPRSAAAPTTAAASLESGARGAGRPAPSVPRSPGPGAR